MSVEEIIQDNVTSGRCIMCGGIKYNKYSSYCLQCQTDIVKYNTRHVDTQEAKADADKPNLSLVPTKIIYEIEKIRAYGTAKYGDPENWKKVELERYHQALLRHTLAVWNDINARDEESGLLHLSHMATNIAFILELMHEEHENV